MAGTSDGRHQPWPAAPSAIIVAGGAMTEVEDFLSAVVGPQEAADRALHDGDAGPRSSMWSTKDPVTLFGAWISSSGHDDVMGTFHELASSFSDCQSFALDIVAAGASGDLAYTVAYERTVVSIDGQPQEPYTLRVTHVYRREDGIWKIVHRHGDRLTHGQRILDSANT
jgi:ketosteroid isomerase-like protein